MYDRTPSTGAAVLDSWDGGLTWVAHPDERGQRASHALEGDDGIWILDPLDGPGVGGFLDGLGANSDPGVAGVAVLSAWHARDAGTLARRYDVAVHVPTWMGRVESRVDAPLERYTLTPGASGFRTVPCRPLPLWDEVFLYDEATGTLVVPDSLGTVEHWCLDGEVLGLAPFRRPQPPLQLRGLEPDRILPGHGRPITTDAASALESGLDVSAGDVVRSLLQNGPASARGVLDAALTDGRSP